MNEVLCTHQINTNAKKPNGKFETVDCGLECQPVEMKNFNNVTFKCPEDHTHIRKVTGVKKTDVCCPNCAKDEDRNYMYHWGLSQWQEPPQSIQEYHYICFECHEIYVERRELRSKHALRFRKEPKIQMEVA